MLHPQNPLQVSSGKIKSVNKSKLLVLLEPQRRRCKMLETGNLIKKFASLANSLLLKWHRRKRPF